MPDGLLDNIRCLVAHVAPVHHSMQDAPYKDVAVYVCLNCGMTVKGRVTFYPLDGTRCPKRCTFDHLTIEERKALLAS